MKVYENANGKVFYKNGTFLVKISHIIGFIECTDYDKALEVLSGDIG